MLEPCPLCGKPSQLIYEMYNYDLICRSCITSDAVAGCRVCHEIFPTEMTVPYKLGKTKFRVCTGCIDSGRIQNFKIRKEG